MSSDDPLLKTFARKKKKNKSKINGGYNGNQIDNTKKNSAESFEKSTVVALQSLAASQRQRKNKDSSKSSSNRKSSAKKLEKSNEKSVDAKSKKRSKNNDGNGANSEMNGVKKEKEKKRKNRKEEEETKECSFAMSRIHRIIKSEGSDYRLSQDAIFLINKATEKFLEEFCSKSYDAAVRDRKHSVSYKNLSSVVSGEKRFDFLSDFVPEKVKAEKALAETKPAEALPG